MSYGDFTVIEWYHILCNATFSPSQAIYHPGMKANNLHLVRRDSVCKDLHSESSGCFGETVYWAHSNDWVLQRVNSSGGNIQQELGSLVSNFL